MKTKIELCNVSLRQATDVDREFAFQVLKTAFGKYVKEVYGWDEELQRQIHRQRFRPSSTWIIKYNDKEIGLLAFDQETDHIRVRQLFLLPEYQGWGIGAHLIKDILKESKQKDIPVRLQVLKVNNRAKVFYERIGFSVTEETETHNKMEYKP